MLLAGVARERLGEAVGEHLQGVRVFDLHETILYRADDAVETISVRFVLVEIASGLQRALC